MDGRSVAAPVAPKVSQTFVEDPTHTWDVGVPGPIEGVEPVVAFADQTAPRPVPRRSGTAIPEGDTDEVFVSSSGGDAPQAVELEMGRRLESGRIVGTYRLDDTLGEGATAVVWRATDLRFKRPIALKLFHARGAATRRALDRVMGEAQSASSVISDYVVRVRDAGQLPDGGPHFIAMELCAAFPDGSTRLTVGRTLEEEVPRSLEEAVRWAEELARGVFDAHRVGVFHRDLKPANVLVRPGSRTAQILDFGLATLTRPPAADAIDGPTRTVSLVVDPAGRQPLCVAGTPAFMAPEQCRGLPWDLDPQRDRELLTRIDVYGVGAVLYTLLAGHEPYLEDTIERSARDVMERVVSRPPRPLRRCRGPFRVPPRLARIVAKAMARDPQDRYADGLELAEDLQAYREGRPTSLDGPFPLLRAGLYARRHKLQVITSLWAVFLVFGIGWSLYMSAETQTAYSRMEEAREAEALAWQDAVSAQAARMAAEARASEATSLSEVHTQEAEDAKAAAARAKRLAHKARSAERTALSTAEQAQLEAAQASSEAELAATDAAEARRVAAQSEALAAAARGAASDAESQRDAAVSEAARSAEEARISESRATSARVAAEAAERRAADAQQAATDASRETARAWSAAEEAEGRAQDAKKEAAAARADAAEARQELSRLRQEVARWRQRALNAEARSGGAGGGSPRSQGVDAGRR